MPILTFLNDAHRWHNPPAEYLHGRAVPFFEMPQRAENILSSLLAANLISPYQPELIDPHILTDIHDADMLDYLIRISTHSQEIIQGDFAVYGLQNKLSGDEYYYESLFAAQMRVGRYNTRKSYIYDSTSPIGAQTWNAVLGSASAAYAGAQAVLDGETHAYALCRPPGHHAGRDFMGGYCYVNNAAVAANLLKARGKVAILDVDYHHGNGTQDIFWEDDDVLYVSIHADPIADYPYYLGFEDENRATNLNLPLPHGTDEAGYLAALEQAMAAIDTFMPSTLVISVGFDIYRGDPMGHFALDVPVFSKIGARIAAAGLPTLYVQEGGYNLDKLGEMAVSFFSGVLR